MVLLVSKNDPKPVRADVASPEMPPGSNLSPGAETTQVWMIAETVTMEVNPVGIGNTYLSGDSAIAKITFVFDMMNKGSK